MIAVINGLQTLLYLCLGIKSAKPIEEDRPVFEKPDTDEILLMNWFPWTVQPILSSDPLEIIKKEIWNLENRQDLLLSCLSVWNGVELFKVRDYYFTRLGSFAYNKADEEIMQFKCKDK